ncbi:MAG: hypothetical protein CL609_16780 [Anaerolineaceae bacterium]|nr:hypothetical protein [Anaerolineaceae bacterium]
MSFISFPILILLALSVVFGTGFAVIAYRARKVIPGGLFVMGVGISVVVWAGAYFVEILVPGLGNKLFWANLKQLGSVLLPFSFLLFSLVYTQFIHHIPRYLYAILAIEPIAVLYVYWNDLSLGLMRINPHLSQMGGLDLIDFTVGEGLAIHFIYSALISISAILLLLVRYFRAKSFYRSQISFIFLGMAIPFLGALAVFLKIVPPYFDMTPLLLGFSFPIMSWGLFRNEFFKSAPLNPQIILERLPFGILIVDMSNEQKIISLNSVTEEILSVEAARAIGKPVSTFLPELNLSLTEFVKELVLDFELNNQFYELHCEHISKENTQQDVWLIVFVNMTAQKLLEESLFASEAMYRSLVENSVEGIAITQNERIIYLNQQMADMLGYSLNELPGRAYKNLISKEFIKLQTEREGKRARGEKVEDFLQGTFIKKNGALLDVEVSSTLIPYQGQNAFLVMVRDITNRKKYEEERNRTLALLEATIESSKDGILVLDKDFEILAHNQRLLELWNLPSDWEKIQSPDRFELIYTQLTEPDVILKTRSHVWNNIDQEFTNELTLINGSVFEEYTVPFYITGELMGRLFMYRDITERRAYELELEKARLLAEDQSFVLQATLKREKQLHDVTRTISRSMEIDTVLSELLRQTLEITNADESHLGLINEDGQSIHLLYGMDREKSFVIDDYIPYNEKFLSWQVIEQRQGIMITDTSHPMPLICFSHDVKTSGIVSLLCVPILSGLSVLGVLGVFSKRDTILFNEHDLHAAEAIASQAGIAIQNARLFEEVNQLAITDPLTRLYNRRYFFNLARVELERAKRYGTDLSFIMLDIDDFKRVNDTYGHLVGDEVLMAVSEVIRKTIRKVDLAARYGGEEMVILLPATSQESALVSAERLREAVEELKIPVDGNSVSVSISLGVSSFEQHLDISISKLLDQADQAMYLSKQNGKNRVTAWQAG